MTDPFAGLSAHAQKNDELRRYRAVVEAAQQVDQHFIHPDKRDTLEFDDEFVMDTAPLDNLRQMLEDNGLALPAAVLDD